MSELPAAQTWLSLNAQHPCKSWAGLSRDREIPQACWSASLADTLIARFTERLFLNKVESNRRQYQISTSGLHIWHMCTRAHHRHTHTYMCAQTHIHKSIDKCVRLRPHLPWLAKKWIIWGEMWAVHIITYTQFCLYNLNRSSSGRNYWLSRQVPRYSPTCSRWPSNYSEANRIDRVLSWS